jgi:hypothetical protein
LVLEGCGGGKYRRVGEVVCWTTVKNVWSERSERRSISII